MVEQQRKRYGKTTEEAYGENRKWYGKTTAEAV